MATILLGFNNNPNIGLYAFVTDKFALVGRELDDITVAEIQRVLDVPVHRVSIAGTSLIGVFLTGNSDMVYVPGIAFENELEDLKKLGIDYTVFNTDLTCLGNNIILNKHGAIMSSQFSNQDVIKFKKLVPKLKVEVSDIADTNTPGACIAINGNLALIHRDISPAQSDLLESTLKLELVPTTINLGVPYIKSGILCNDKGLIIGEASGPAEITYAESGLGYIL